MKMILPIMILPTLLLSGCAHDNGIVIKPAPKSTQAENVDAYGRAAFGAWKIITGEKK